MTFDGGRFLSFANAVVGSEWPDAIEEAANRSAISRAYYAAFLVARNVARNEGVPLNFDGTDHKAVIKYFSSQNDPKRKTIGRQLASIRDDRNAADYDCESSVESDLPTCLETARLIVETLG